LEPHGFSFFTAVKISTTMEEKSNLTAERSLEIIRESIERSQRTINKNSAIPLIWWGACVVAFSLFIAYLWKNHGGPAWNMLWAILWLVGYAGNWLIDKRRERVPTTFVGKTIGHVWATFGVFCCGVGMIFGFIGCGMLPMELILPKVYAFGCITSVISLCFGMGTTITGLVIRNRVIQVCGLVAGIGGFFGALHFPGHAQLYVMAVVALIGLIVPGVTILLQNQK
jgi:hypothetical protein